jgi:hypothetical protein
MAMSTHLVGKKLGAVMTLEIKLKIIADFEAGK